MHVELRAPRSSRPGRRLSRREGQGRGRDTPGGQGRRVQELREQGEKDVPVEEAEAAGDRARGCTLALLQVQE